MSLTLAVLEGDLARVRDLIEAGADLHSPTTLGTPLQAAAGQGNLAMVCLLLDSGCDLEAGNSLGSPLRSAIEKGRVAVALELLNRGARPVHLAGAVRQGMLEVVRRLLELGLDPNQRLALDLELELKDYTPLHLAARLGNKDCLELLLEAGASAAACDAHGREAWRLAPADLQDWLRNSGGATAQECLWQSARSGDLALLELALQQGAQLEARETSLTFPGQTPIILASAAGHLSLVRKLIEVGADLQAKDAQVPSVGLKSLFSMGGEQALEGQPLGMTALAWAARNGHVEVVKELLRAGADPEVQDFLARTARAWAIHRGHLAVVQVLLDRYPPTSAELLDALECGQSEIALHLLRADAPLKGSRKGQTALGLAAERVDLELLEELLSRKASLKVGKNASPALVQLVGATHPVPISEAPAGNWVRQWNERGGVAFVPYPDEQVLAALDLLLGAGLDVNQEGPFGSPILVAARQGRIAVVRRLVAAGAQPNCRHQGQTPLSMAQLFGHQEVVDYLESLTSIQPVPEVEPQPPPWIDLAIPDFVADESFLEILEELRLQTSARASQPQELRGGSRLHLPASASCLDFYQLQREYAARGLFLFENLPDTPNLTWNAIPARHWRSALALMQTQAPNHQLSPGYVLQWLEQLEREQPFQLRCICGDLLTGQFLSPIKEPKKLAQAMYEFCDDIVEQGCGTVANLAKQLKKHPAQLYFWWD